MIFSQKNTKIIALACMLSCFTFMADAAYTKGDRGPEVKLIQSRLSHHGFTIVADGVFGSGTEAVVKKFQKQKGLKVDGVVGPATYKAIVGREEPVSRSVHSNSTVRRLISVANQYQGVPYVFGGSTPKGFDCSGYVRHVYSSVGIDLPRSADTQYHVGQSVSRQHLVPGDLVFFETYTSGVSHSGIYIGNDEFISATSSNGVVVRSLHDEYWGERYIGARRVL